MDQQEGLTTNKPPLFTGENYVYWSVRMRCHLMSLGWKVWEETEKEINIGNQYPIDTIELGEYEGNDKALNAILSGLTNTLFTKVMQCTSAKQAWDKWRLSMKENLRSKNLNCRHIKVNLKVLKSKKKRILMNTFFMYMKFLMR